MLSVTKKSDLQIYLDKCIAVYHDKGVAACVKEVENQLLNKKVKFPLLEYCGNTFYQDLATKEHIDFCDQIEALKTEGGNVILGIMLQNRLEEHFNQSIQKATRPDKNKKG